MFNKRRIKVRGPQPSGLSINRDEAGVPNVKASSFKDALWGSGYAHAIDRGTQLLMMRILGQGRLTELLSDTEESLAIDKFFRRANWYGNLTQELNKLDVVSLSQIQSYCDGVNAGFSAGEFSLMKLLGYQAEPWKVQDIILISRMTSYLTLAQSQAEVERFFIELTQSGVSTEALAELFPIDVKRFDRELVESIQLQERIVPREVIWNQALPRMMASNNWVVAGSRTKSGRAIMANDPHLEVNRLPNVWCEQSLSWSGGSLIGMGMPGLPGVLVGRNKQVAWGVTYTFMDTVDSWVEDCKGGQYRKDGAWHDFATRREVIKRKKSADVELCYYENKHGVLEGDPAIAGHYIATRWAAADSGAASIMAALKMGDMSSAAEAMATLGKIESAWNWVIADSEDNIAYQMSGLMPKRCAGWNGFVPISGCDSNNDWQGLVDIEDLPCAYNPENGYLVTANQDLNHLGRVDPINMPMGDYRASRIEEVLASHKTHDIESMKALQMDVYSKQAGLFLDILLPLLESNGETGELYQMLKQWDHRYDLDSIGAPVFEAFYDLLRKEVFGLQRIGLGGDVIEHLSQDSGLFIDFYQNFDRILVSDKSAWYCDITRDEAYLSAFNKLKALKEPLSKKHNQSWGEVNTIALNNIVFQGKLPTFLGFDTESIPLLGGRATPHQGQVYRSAGRDTSFAPSVRLIADMGESSLHTCLAGGPSDSRFSRWYKSGLDDWRVGRYKILDS